jgi:hypothetical protein
MRSARGKAMNLNTAPTTEELQQLLAQHDDRAGDHVLWVDDRGDVHLSQLPRNLTADAFERSRPDMRLRCETFQKGNEYVGPGAASDEAWVARLFETLVSEWPKANARGEVAYVELSW